MNNRADLTIIAILLPRILEKESDQQHPLSVLEMRQRILAEGYTVDRRSLYKVISLLEENEYPIRKKPKGHGYGYWYDHSFSSAEIFLLKEAVRVSPAFSIAEAEDMHKRLDTLLSDNEQKTLPVPSYYEKNADSALLQKNIRVILQALSSRKKIRFLYFDITAKKARKYRREKAEYLLSPYALVFSEKWYYAILYSDKHDGFANYRLDKMDHLMVTEEERVEKPFDQESHMRSSLHMYSGKKETATVVFPIRLSSVVLDEFGDGVIVSKADETTFTANIRTAITPAFTGWLLQFGNDITVLKPASLREALYTTGQKLIEIYGGK